MLALDKTLKTITQQLAAFSLTAKLLVAALMVILVMGLLFVAAFAGRSELVALGLGGEPNAAAKAQAVRMLEMRQVQWQERNGDVYVPADQRIPVLASLAENRSITTDQIDFSSILKDSSPFTDRNTKNKRYLVAKMNVVGEMISALNGVAKATVVIDQPDRGHGIGHARIDPSASVYVLPDGEQLTQTQADAIARMVAGAHAALKVDRVEVIDGRTGRPFRGRSDDHLAATKHLDVQQAAEKHIKRKIDDVLSYIPGVRVAINAQVDSSDVVEREIGVEDPKLGVREERSYEESMTNRSAAAEPGVRPNTGLDLSTGGGRLTSLTKTETDTSMLPVFPTRESRTRRAGGQALKVNATVLVPRSYYVAVYQIENGAEQEPDAATLQTIVERENQKIREEVTPLVDTGAVEGAIAGTVVVSMFADVATAGVGALGSEGRLGGGGGIAGGLVSDSLVKTIGLGLLAAVSLMLMFMMVRKASRQDEMPSAEELVGIPPALAEADSDLVGEAAESVPAMEGLEIDEEAIRRKQMLDQINELARNAPDEAANLLRKWITTDD
jgi:flagellar biosynthesis/type III secretory pathway M-ring protein FliF/YscJ